MRKNYLQIPPFCMWTAGLLEEANKRKVNRNFKYKKLVCVVSFIRIGCIGDSSIRIDVNSTWMVSFLYEFLSIFIELVCRCIPGKIHHGGLSCKYTVSE